MNPVNHLKGTQSMSEVEMFREYVDVVRPPDPPRAKIGDIELLSQTIAIRIWALRTKHDLATVLRSDFFDDLRDVRLKRCDRIEVVASWDASLAEHAALCVDRIDGTGNATVSLLHRYERQH
jgi:hypothetical protein